MCEKSVLQNKHEANSGFKVKGEVNHDSIVLFDSFFFFHPCTYGDVTRNQKRIRGGQKSTCFDEILWKNVYSL